MKTEKNEYIERLKRYNKRVSEAELDNHKNEEKIADEIIKNSELEHSRDKSEESSEGR
ncbi:MAG: hypothetical protein IJH12_08295 [Clostridia bacterium]|nr:hypothetical protein [Clostridia bacterium]